MTVKSFYVVGLIIAILVFIFSLSFLMKKEEGSYIPVSFSELPAWDKDNFNEALPAFIKSCTKLDDNWKNICDKLKVFDGSNEQLKKLLEDNLQPYKIVTESEGLFTGYYEAELKGSLEKTKEYNVPVYGFPNDMISIDLRDFGYDNSKKPKFFAMVKDGKAVPYPSRAEIEKNINAPILLWVDDEADLFLLHIQGSGRVKLPDGSYVKLGYMANNEHPFIGIGSVMKNKGLLESGKTSMPDIREWLRLNPERAKEIMLENPRYIFFRFNDKEGAVGSLGVPLTAKRSLAIDEEYIELGIPLWLDTMSASGEKIQRLVFAQDTGKAIKGMIRGDFFWGFGEEAFKNAGRMKSKGTYFILLPKDSKNVKN